MTKFVPRFSRQKLVLFLCSIMKIIIGFFIFCLVLFIYLHIQFHLKTSEDLEIYEIDQPSKNKLEEICDLRQPVLFDFDSEKIMETSSKSYISNHYDAFEIKIRNVHEEDPNVELYIPLQVNASMKLFNQDKSANYFSENNMDFLEETSIVKNLRYNDEIMRPYMVSNCNYDVMFGSNNTCTPFRYELNYRNFFLLTQGSAQIQLAAPHCSKYLQPVYDYESFEFRSPVNPWNPQPKFKSDFDKIKCLEFTLMPGKTLFIPAYWWYSIKFNNDASITCFRYRTYMNNIAILPYIGMHALQIQNVKRNVVKKASISQLNHEIIVPLENTEVDVDLSNAELNNVSIVNSTLDNNFESGTSINELPDVVDSNI